MKILHICNYNGLGGAGNASERLRKALVQQGVSANSIVREKLGSDPDVSGMMDHVLARIVCKLRTYPLNRLLSLFGGGDRSIACFPTGLLRRINSADADVVHLHWINAEMISIAQIARIRKPVVWTFHDMWPVCGAEHYAEDERFIQGYVHGRDKKLSANERILNWVDCVTWNRKVRCFQGFRFQIVTPGNWMTSCVQKSYLFNSYPVRTIYNCLNLDVFKPQHDKMKIRRKLNLPVEKKIILFGAYSVDEPRKGGDLLDKALPLLKKTNEILIAVFGREGDERIADMNTVWLGRIEGDEAMAEVCSCADVVCVPSRQETFGQTASEPLACGVPVVAFNATGLKDVVDHKVNGYLAEPFSVEDYARGIDWVLSLMDEDPAAYDALCREARNKAERCFSMETIAQQHLEVYRDAIRTFNEAGEKTAG